MTIVSARDLAPAEDERVHPEDRLTRDQWDRPLINPPGGGRKVGYRRASSFGGPLESDYNLQKWGKRQVARGIARTDHLAIAVTRAETRLRDAEETSDWRAAKAAKKELDDLCEAAMVAVGSDTAAEIGTALHHICERIDLGLDPGHIPTVLAADVKAYVLLTRPRFRMVSVERFVVQDELRVGGTLDRAAELLVPMTPTDDRGEPIGEELPAGTVLIDDIKGLALSTPIPTPDGWTTMGEVVPGDRVLGSDGRPYRVTAKSATKSLGTYVVRFDDGSQVVCDPEHIWWVSGGDHRYGPPRPVGIEEIRSRLRSNQGQAWWRVPVAQPLELPDRELSIDPYLLGCWLGDGSAASGRITKGRDLFEILMSDGHELGNEHPNHSEQCFTRTVIGLRTHLREQGLLQNKHIPTEYLRSSRGQRLRLLQGLMDTDGTWNTARRRAMFATTDKVMALAVEELLLTLGQRPHVSEVQIRGFGKLVTAYHVEFLPVDLDPFRLPRKAAKVTRDVPATRARRRVIVDVELGPDVETACIAVDSPDRTYLCGDRMIPTHNTAQEMSFAGAKFGVQNYCYASGIPYNTETGVREEWGHPAPSLEWALITHVPSKQGKAALYWVDLAAAREAAEEACTVYEWRNSRGKRLITKAVVVDAPAEDFFLVAKQATSVDELLAAHRRAVTIGAWNDVLKQEFSRCKAKLEAAASTSAINEPQLEDQRNG